MSTLALARRRSSIWGAFGVIASLAAGLAVYSYLSYVKDQLPVAGRLAPMVVAAHDIEPGAALDASMVRLEDHPERYMPEGAIASIDIVLGRRAVMPILAGEPVTARKLGTKGGLSSVVPPGMRAYSLMASIGSGLGSEPTPGDRVDVLATFPREVMGEPTTITILTSKEVASAGASSRRDSGKVASRLGLDAAGSQALSITLFVTPEEAEKLAMAEALGRLTIVLSPARPEEAKPRPIKPGDLTK